MLKKISSVTMHPAFIDTYLHFSSETLSSHRALGLKLMELLAYTETSRKSTRLNITIETTSSLDTAAGIIYFYNKFYINYLIKQQQKQLIRDIHSQEIV